MIKRYINRLLSKNREFLVEHILVIRGFMQLLMKQRNTGVPWTREEKKQIKQHLKTMAAAVPLLIIFLPPGGGILLPILVDLLDRRKNARELEAQKGADQSQARTIDPNDPGNCISV
jgi:hypothetical protein